jgi:arylsulfatase A-like enzyme
MDLGAVRHGALKGWLRELARAACLASCLCAASSCAPGAEGERRPLHLVLATVEGLRADRVVPGAGVQRPLRPTANPEVRLEGRAFGFDDLAERGVTFANAYASSPALAPALGSLHCGRSPIESGLERDGEWLPGEQATIAELCGAAGFDTAAFAHDPEGELQAALGQGFQHFSSCADDAEVLAKALDWLRARDAGSERRTFLWIHLAGPSFPLDEPAEDEAAPPAWLVTRSGVRPERIDAARATELAAAALDDPAGRTAVELAYDRAVWRVEAGLAGLLEMAHDPFQPAAEASEAWPRTAFVLCGVAPTMLFERGVAGAAPSLCETRLRVPLLLHHPDSLPGGRIEDPLVDLADLRSTCIEWLGLEDPRDGATPSLQAQLEQRVPRREWLACAYDRVFSVRDARLRLVWNPLRKRWHGQAAGEPPAEVERLHEVALDPRATRDLAGAAPRDAARLQALVKRWREGLRPFPPHKKPRREP